MSRNDIGVAIATEQARRGLTDSALSEMLGVNAATVTRWRLGNSVPQPRHAVRLSALTGIPLAEVERMIAGSARKPPPEPVGRQETFGVMLRSIEAERGLTSTELFRAAGIDKSRYYRLRNDRAAPRTADIPDLARRLQVPEERVVLAAYRSELARTGQLPRKPHTPSRDHAHS
jgi:transcriptional regulator with XRE-family HTH domain